MSLSDPIADMLTRIRNAQLARKKNVSIPFSKIKQSIAKVLQDEGYINAYSETVEATHANLQIELKYHAGMPVIETIARVSKPGMRIYKPVSQIPEVLGGLGVSIISTSKGVMTGQKAKQMGVGGEILCEVV